MIAYLFSLSAMSFSQTTGNLTFSCKSVAPSGTYGAKCVFAIWIENTQAPSAFIKTKVKYGYQDDHLTSWLPKSGGSIVDATTGPTQPSSNTPSFAWNGTSVGNVVVPDGTYNIFIEMGWGSNKTANHSVMSFSFVKGPTGSHLTPTGNAYFSNVVIDWAPLTTLINVTEDPVSLTVYPNPSNGLLNLEIKKSIPSAKLMLVNSLGSLVFQKNLEEGFTGVLNIDLNEYKNGLYLLKINSPEYQFVYKVVLQK
jgi:hypothetical protein